MTVVPYAEPVNGHYGDPLCRDCRVDVYDADEYSYMVTDEVWAEAGLCPDEGMLCIGCIEQRLERHLDSQDFLPDAPINRGKLFDQSPRLRDRLSRLSVGEG